MRRITLAICNLNFWIARGSGIHQFEFSTHLPGPAHSRVFGSGVSALSCDRDCVTIGPMGFNCRKIDAEQNTQADTEAAAKRATIAECWLLTQTGGKMLRNLLAFAFCIIANSASAQVNLGSYNVSPNTVTVAGVSSGGFMAVQLQVAYSKSIFGTAVFAGGTYFRAQDDLAVWGTACLTGIGVPVASLVSFTNSQATAGRIDPVSNIGGKPIYMFSGLLDTTVQQLAMNHLHAYYQSFTNSHITYNNSTEAEHSWVTPDGVNPCLTLGAPFINNCGIDPEETFLTMLWGAERTKFRHAGRKFYPVQPEPVLPQQQLRLD
jgi:hypothetical protein